MTTEATIDGTIQVYRVSIRASAQAIWDAITTPEWTARYGYGAPAHYDLRPGGAYRSLATQGMKEYGAPDVVVEGEVLEVDPPHRLVQTWRMLFSPELDGRGPHAPHLGDRRGRRRRLHPHGHPRSRRRPRARARRQPARTRRPAADGPACWTTSSRCSRPAPPSWARGA